jgi:hypothetical protein
MPNRYIRESAIESEAVCSLAWQAEVFYRRLLNRVDDFGRFTASVPLLRASIFPLQLDRVRDSDIPRLLTECEKAGLLFVYSAGQKQYLVMNKWEKGRAKQSEYPAPPAEVCERMQTFVYTCKHARANVSDSDSDSDTDNKGASPPPLPDGLNTEAFRTAWADYLAYRTAQHFRSLKPVSVTKQLAECATWGEAAAIEAIRTTIRNGWQGLFPPKGGTVRRPAVAEPALKIT